MESIEIKLQIKNNKKDNCYDEPKGQIEDELNLKIYNDIDLIFKRIKDSIKL
mgnify:CR=1 FL=1